MQLQKSPSNEELNKILASLGISKFDDLCKYVKNLPYGRNANRSDFLLVLKEKKGTCSSKHGFLKWAAEVNKVKGVRLIMAIYKMDGFNTPKVAKVLEKYALDYIPEAHCYLEIAHQKYDFTSPSSDFDTFKEDIIEEQEIKKNQLIEYKLDYHKRFLKEWLLESPLNFELEELWRIREVCISALSEN